MTEPPQRQGESPDEPGERSSQPESRDDISFFFFDISMPCATFARMACRALAAQNA
jgi:hypothetical protein